MPDLNPSAAADAHYALSDYINFFEKLAFDAAQEWAHAEEGNAEAALRHHRARRSPDVSRLQRLQTVALRTLRPAGIPPERFTEAEKPLLERINRFKEVSVGQEFLGEWREALNGLIRLRQEYCDWAVAAPASDAQSDPVTLHPGNPEPPRPVRAKKSTSKGEAETKIIAALTAHHQYAADSSLNQEPAQVNELVRKQFVASSTVSDFFKREFGGHTKYRFACSKKELLLASLKALNDGFRPRDFLNARTSDEVAAERADDE